MVLPLGGEGRGVDQGQSCSPPPLKVLPPWGQPGVSICRCPAGGQAAVPRAGPGVGDPGWKAAPCGVSGGCRAHPLHPSCSEAPLPAKGGQGLVGLSFPLSQTG